MDDGRWTMDDLGKGKIDFSYFVGIISDSSESFKIERGQI